jgi:hypothetical protein
MRTNIVQVMAVIGSLASLGASIYLASILKNGDAAVGYAFLSIIFGVGAYLTGPQD